MTLKIEGKANIKNMIDPTVLLNDFFDKSLLISLSAQIIDHNWGEKLNHHIRNHAFTDPFNEIEQTDPEQVRLFNTLMNTTGDTIKWRTSIISNSQLYIEPNNKEKFIPEAISQLYLQLSIPLFENFIELLGKFLTKKDLQNSFCVINEFYAEFKSELKDLDDKNVSYRHPTILLLHNLRLFRNCITHAEGAVSDLEKAFDEYNKNIDENKKGYKVLKDLGPLSKTRFRYMFSNEDTKIHLDKKAFENLTDLYRCFCKKREITAEIS